jgi:hypothetical protein
VADGYELASLAQSDEAPETAARHVLKEDSFDRFTPAELEDLLERRPLDQARHCRGR